MKLHFKKIILFIALLVFSKSVIIYSTNNINYNDDSLVPLKKIIVIEPSANEIIPKEELNDIQSIKYVLNISGITFSTATLEDLKNKELHSYDIIIVPFAASKNMTNENITQIKDAVNSGSCLFFDGLSPIKDVFGLKIRQKPLKVDRIRDLLFNNPLLYWPYSDNISVLDKNTTNCSVICVDEKNNLPLMVSGSFGKGKYIYFANLFDPYTTKGYTRYPFLIEVFNSVFGPINLAERRFVEMYFDPGFNKYPLNFDELAKKWKKQMIKVIYAAGWYYDNQDVNYEKLLKACHENGIAVFCWLEPPMISKKFWDNNKEWREKTAFLKDAHIDWRYLMNLTDSSCRRKVFSELEVFLTQYDWDGVNLAELYFDPVNDGRQNPKNFTPMNDAARNEFKTISGFDPISLFDRKSIHSWKSSNADWMKYIAYRKDLSCRLKSYFLDFLSEINKKKSNFEIMLTAIDVSITPEVANYIGEDFKNTIELYNKYPITLQIEDPSNSWGSTPDRYDSLGKEYRKYIPNKNSLIFDCNVVDCHLKGFGGFPSVKPTGEEIRQIIYNISIEGVRPAFYSEASFYPGDFKNISTILARETKITVVNDSTWEIVSPYMVFVHTGVKENAFELDNKSWQTGEDDYVIIPQGEHFLSEKKIKKNLNDICLFSISGNLESADFNNNSIMFTYNEQHISCYAIVNKNPSSIIIDNVQSTCEVFMSSSGTFSIKLPKGRHVVKLVCD
jgi:hypothetical protein